MNVVPLATRHRYATFFRVFAVCIQRFFVICLATTASVGAAKELEIGEIYPLTITDVDQNKHSTSDGYVTLITVVTKKDEAKAQAVADRYPVAYLEIQDIG